MSQNFHEPLLPSEIKPPLARATGLVLGAAAVIVAVIWHATPVTFWIATAIALLLLAASRAAPRLLEPLNVVWFRIGLLLHRVVNPVIMFLLFSLVFVPAGLLLRLRHDPLRSKRAKGAASYWIARDGAQSRGESMTKQF